MSLRLRSVLLAAGFSSLSMFSAGALAGAHADQSERSARGHKAPPIAQILSRVADELDLTEAQVAMLDDMKAEAKSDMKAMRAERQERQGELAEMLSADKINRKLVHARIQERADQRAEAAHQAADTLMDFFDSLDDAQRATLLEQIEEMEARRAERSEERSERLEDDDSERSERSERARRSRIRSE